MDKVKIGNTIKIINMEDEPQYTNRVGTVTHIDDARQIHGTWGVLSFQRLIHIS